MGEPKGLLGGVAGVFGIAAAAMLRRSANAFLAAGANTIGRQVHRFGGVEDFTNRVIAPADVGLYRHVVDAFGGDKNVVNLATPQNGNIDAARLGIRYSKASIDYVFANQANGASIHFHLDGLVINAPSPEGGTVDFSPVYKTSNVASGGGGLVKDTVTAHELRYLARRIHRNQATNIQNPNVTFY